MSACILSHKFNSLLTSRYRVTDAMKGVMKASGLSTFDAVVPNEIGGMNSFEALIAAGRFGKSVLDTDLVARAYPKIWQTVRCLKDVPVAPAAVSDGAGKTHVRKSSIQNTHSNIIIRSGRQCAITSKQKMSCATCPQISAPSAECA